MVEGRELAKSHHGVGIMSPMCEPDNEIQSKESRHENAAGKKLCGMCAHKEDDKWKCLLGGLCPASTATCIAFERKPSPYRETRPGKVRGHRVPQGVHMLYVGRPSRPEAKKDGARAHKGVLTVAVRIKESPNFLEMGFSFWHPKRPWCKMKARDAALERLVVNPLVIQYLYEPRRMARQASFAIAAHDWKRLSQFGVIIPRDLQGHVPSWTKKFWKTLPGTTPRMNYFRSPGLPMFLLEALANSPPLGRPGRLIFHSPRQIGKTVDLSATEVMDRMAADLARLEGRR